MAATGGTVAHFTSWFGLTPRESSSGSRRQLAGISKRGDRYLRMLLTHGARSVLLATRAAALRGKEPTGVRQWVVELLGRMHHNKAVCALANKLARIGFAVLRDQEPFGSPAARAERKSSRLSFEPAC